MSIVNMHTCRGHITFFFSMKLLYQVQSNFHIVAKVTLTGMQKTTESKALSPPVPGSPLFNPGDDDDEVRETVSIPGEQISGLNFANFNQDYTCISVGYENGVRIYNCDPFTQCYERVDGSIGIVEMLFCSSLLAIVGTGEQNALSPRRLKIMNTKRQTIICELTFPTSILAIRMNRERLVVLLEEVIYIYDITNMRLLHTVEIPSNPLGLIALSIDTENNYLAYPSPQKISKAHVDMQPSFDITGVNGTLTGKTMTKNNTSEELTGNGTEQVHNVRNGDVIIFDCKTLQPISVIDAHKTQLSALAFSHDGSLLATASDKGTIVRVFSVQTGLKLYQFRRGSYNTRIYSLAFSASNIFLAASSATGTVHIFRLGEEEAKNTILKNKGASGWLNSKKTATDKSIEATRQEELDKLLKSQQSKMDLAEGSGDYGLSNENTKGEYNLNENLNQLIIHSDSEDEVDLNQDDEEDEDEDEGDEEEDADEQYESVDYLYPLNSDGQSKGHVGGAASIISSSSNGTTKTQPIVDSKRRSVARMLRRTSQSLGRKAAEKMGTYLPPKFSSILEPNRHFASFKVPTTNENMSIVGIIESSIDANDLSEDTISHYSKVTYRDDVSSSHSMKSNLSRVSSTLRHYPQRTGLAVYILVVSSEGMFYQYRLDPERGGDCVMVSQRSLLD